ncbi:GumC family protein [Novosphingobium sp. BL-52-GroH]|uniref:GumC family protein n=1 Tax=Novosphingobium sp. BL-52-GroH TaxID=3349877 RepID=UPI00384C3A5C
MSNRTHDAAADEISAKTSKRLLPDPSEIGALFFRRRWIFATSFLVTLALVVTAISLLPRTYTATSALLLEPREAQPVKVNDRGFVAPADDNLIDTAVQIVRSPTLTLDVVRSLRLDQVPEFGGGQAASDAPARRALAPPTDASSEGIAMTATERRASGALLARSYVRRVGVTYLVEISASSASPRLAAQIANALARRYIDLDSARKQTRNAQSARYVASQAAALRKQAVTDDAALQQYMVRNNLMSAQGATMAEQEVSELNRQIADAQAQLAEQRGKLAAAQAQIGRGGGGADIGSVLASETIRQLRQQEAVASAHLAQLDARYGALHPEVVQARDELADVRQQLNAELARIVSGLRGDVQIAESRLGSLLGSRALAKGSLAQNGSAQVGRLELERRAEASRAIYSAYLTRAKETAQAGELPNADASIDSLARVPGAPSSPNYLLSGLAGVAAALLVAGLATAIAEYMENTVATRADIEGGLEAVYAGAIPTLDSATRSKAGNITPQDYVTIRSMSLFTESLRNLATYLGLSGNGGIAVVTITSPLPREGKSTTSMCLARTLAMGKRKVVLVDADVRHHSTSDALAPGRDREGLFRALDGTTPIEQALTSDDRTSLQILTTLGQSNPDDIITEETMAALIAALRARFDIIIIDSAPVLGVAETRIVSRLSDTTLVVARWRTTPVKAVRTALDLLSHNGSKVGGVALSLVNIKEYASAGLTDAFGYYKKFKGYYAD